MTTPNKDFAAELKDILKNYRVHRVGSHSDDWGGQADELCFCDLKATILKAHQSAVKEARIEDLRKVKNEFTAPDWLPGIRRYCLERIKKLKEQQ
jgi:hypothetical protein